MKATEIDNSAQDCIKLCDAADAVGQWLYDWQTLLGALLALGAAIWAGKLLRKQISQADEFHRDQIKHSHNAARVVLPLALSSIDKMCRTAANRITHAVGVRENFDDAFNEAQTEHHYSNRLKPLTLDSDVISKMKDFAESLRGKKSVRHVAELMSSIQILTVRFNELDIEKGEKVVLLGLGDLLILVGKVKLLNDSVYGYARFVDSKFAIIGRASNQDIWDQILQRVEELVVANHVSDHFLEIVRSKVERKKKDEKSPWLEKLEYDR